MQQSSNMPWKGAPRVAKPCGACRSWISFLQSEDAPTITLFCADEGEGKGHVGCLDLIRNRLLGVYVSVQPAYLRSWVPSMMHRYGDSDNDDDRDLFVLIITRCPCVWGQHSKTKERNKFQRYD